MKKIIFIMLISVFVMALVGCAERISATYVNIDSYSKNDYIEFKSNGEFFTQESGVGFTGKYEIEKDIITLKLDNGFAARATMRGDVLVDSEGERWINISKNIPTNNTVEFGKVREEGANISGISTQFETGSIIYSEFNKESKFGYEKIETVLFKIENGIETVIEKHTFDVTPEYNVISYIVFHDGETRKKDIGEYKLVYLINNEIVGIGTFNIVEKE